MTLLRRVPWDITEEALSLLNLTVADFASLPVVRGGRWCGTSAAKWARFDARQVRSQGQYLRIVSIAEAYVDTVSETLFDKRVETLETFFRNLTAEVQEKASSSWNDRKKCFENHHGFALNKCSGWADFDRAIEVRNSIAHGLGVITKKQLSSGKDAKILQSKVKISDGRIIVTAESLSLCINACRVFIRSVDDHLPRQ
ncbi:hypothetical protein H0264_28825 [Nocardia huaxiensis]|uniref:RiboL-PSP-HEPN domain-containing protein n=1 Tax=Nocardia huaxiensis TaxID=2755382 RepID=A0A7D6V8D8_9NOCA|nr:hypothetical protein [Nocardia huaxiensis]QLY29254.1 hypothetical protein H0264_28825 [Nocardia huaxiensis]